VIGAVEAPNPTDTVCAKPVPGVLVGALGWTPDGPAGPPPIDTGEPAAPRPTKTDAAIPAAAT
jgi:hypothetical protein